MAYVKFVVYVNFSLFLNNSKFLDTQMRIVHALFHSTIGHSGNLITLALFSPFRCQRGGSLPNAHCLSM